MINIFRKRIFSTGGDHEGFLFKTLIIDESELNLITKNNIELKDIANTLGIDFICVKRIETIDFLHITNIDNEKSINKKGLVLTKSDFIYDLGNGIYGVLNTKNPFYDGIENLKDYIADHMESDKVLVVTGEYTGEYIECIFGEGHEGYIVMYNDIPEDQINDLKIMDIDDFLYSYLKRKEI